jgi:hypothetical protein
MDDALVPVHKDEIAVQRLSGDARGVDDQWNGQRAGDDGGMGPDGAFLQHHPPEPPPVIQKLGRTDVARHEDRVGRHLGARVGALTGQEAQKPVRQIVEIVQPLAQIGVGDSLHPGAGGGLFLFHGGLGAEPAGDILLHPPHPAAGTGEHPVGLQHLALFRIARRHTREHLVHVDAQPVDRLAQPHEFDLRVVGHRPCDHDARFMEPDMAHGGAFLRAAAAEHLLAGMPLAQRCTLAGEGAELRHLGKDHGDDFEGVDLVVGEFARVLGLDDENAEPFAQPHDWYAEEGGIPFLARLGHVAKAALARGVGRVHGARRTRDTADEALADPHPGNVDGLGRKSLGRTELERVGVAKQVDRAHLGAHGFGDQARDAVEPFLSFDRLRHHRLQARQKLAAFAFAFALLDHRPLLPLRQFLAPDPGNRHTARLRRGATFNRRRVAYRRAVCPGDARAADLTPPGRARMRRGAPARPAPCISGRSGH